MWRFGHSLQVGFLLPLSLLFLPEVADDLSEASAWYEERHVGLGDAFLSCVEACLEVLRKLLS